MNTTNPTYEQYRKRAAKFAKDHEVTITDHVLDVMTSVMMTRDGIWQGGSFVQAVVKNDLFHAVTRADNECITHPNLKIIVLAYDSCFL